jgi:YbgC/YbaW family acyl-CoA thioester hydrolase
VSDYTRAKVRSYHLDQYGHMSIAAYNMFFEEARWVLFETYNASDFFSKLELALTLVSSTINYRRPCFLGDSLEIHTKIMKIGNSSCNVQQNIYLDGGSTLIAECDLVFVLMDKKTLKSVQIEGSARDKLEQFADIF